MKTYLGIAALGLVCFGAFPSLAQTDSRTTTVNDRPRPELDAQGLRRGGFLVFPSVELSETYNDNIFAADTGEIDDFITHIKPALNISSDWNNHSLEFTGEGNIYRYADYDKEDTEQYSLGVSGRLDIQRDANANASFRHDFLAEDRSSPDDAGGSEPTEYTVDTLSLGFLNRWNRVSLTGDGSLTVYDYDDVPTTTTPVNNDDRDRDEYRVSLRGEYEIVPEYSAYVTVIANSIEYDAPQDDSGINRDNDGFEVRAGARLDLSGLVFGDVFAGYITRDYDDPTLKSVDVVTAGVDLTWNATQLTTVVGTLNRTVNETTLASASGAVNTALNARVDHEFLRNLILSGNAGLSRNDFQGIGREDDTFTAGLSARYLLNRNFYFTLQYDYTGQDSNTADNDYRRNRILLRVRAQI